MRVTRLDIAGLRRFERVSLTPGPGLNVLTGDNGAGKTSVLEALHLMAYGRSFRGRVRDGLIRQGDPAVEIFVGWEELGGMARLANEARRSRGIDGPHDGAQIVRVFDPIQYDDQRRVSVPSWCD